MRTQLKRAGQMLGHIALGSEVDRRVLPAAAITFIYSASFATFWVYVGIFAVKGLHWPASRVGLLFLLSAPAAAIANYLSGRVSDRTGRKRPIVVSFLASSANMIALSLLGAHTPLAFALILLQGILCAPAYSLHRILVAESVPTDDERERAYASVRVATNLGTFVGPPCAALLIYLGGWTSFLLGIAALGIVGASLTIALLPMDESTPDAERDLSSLKSVLRNRPFRLLLLSTLLAFTDYCGFETVLPVIAVAAYGVAPATWGLLVAINPVLVVLFQLRLTKASARIAAGPRLAAGTLLMGLPFLALLGSNSLPVIAAVIIAFVVGEMLWLPTSQAVAAQLAPARSRGTYFGAFAATTGPAWTLAPFIAFKLRAHAGVDSIWVLFAAISVVAATAGYAAVRAATAAADRFRPHAAATERS